jgi:hypothetical protein
MVVGFLREAAWQSTPKRSKTIAAQRLSSTNHSRGCRDDVSVFFLCGIGAAPLSSIVGQAGLAAAGAAGGGP